MRAVAYGLLLTGLIGCGPHETRFIPDFADRFCDLVLECEDPAVLVFDGIEDREDCLSLYGNGIDSQGEGCKYKRKRGKRCLRAMELMTCPTDGTPLRDALPLECDEVYIKCSRVPEDDDLPDDEEGEDTGS